MDKNMIQFWSSDTVLVFLAKASHSSLSICAQLQCLHIKLWLRRWWCFRKLFSAISNTNWEDFTTGKSYLLTCLFECKWTVREQFILVFTLQSNLVLHDDPVLATPLRWWAKVSLYMVKELALLKTWHMTWKQHLITCLTQWCVCDVLSFSW